MGAVARFKQGDFVVVRNSAIFLHECGKISEVRYNDVTDEYSYLIVIEGIRVWFGEDELSPA